MPPFLLVYCVLYCISYLNEQFKHKKTVTLRNVSTQSYSFYLYHRPPAAFSSRFIIAAPTPCEDVVVAKIIVASVLSH